MHSRLQKHLVYLAWLRISVGLPLAFLVMLLAAGLLFVQDNPRVFFSVFGTGDPLLVGFLVLASVVQDTELELVERKNLGMQMKRLLSAREFLLYGSIAALLLSFLAKFFSLSERFTEQQFENLVAAMNVEIAGLLLCVCAAIWLKRTILSRL